MIKTYIQTLWQRKWLRISGYSLLALLVLLTMLPFVIQYSISYLLVQQGAKEVVIEDINLNLFSGEFELKKLDISTVSEENIMLAHMYVNLNMLDIVSSRIIADQLRISGLKVNINRSKKGDLFLNGFTLISSNDAETESPATEPTGQTPIAFGITELALSDIQVTYSEDHFSQTHHLDDLTLSDLRSWDNDSMTRLNLSMLIGETAVKLQSDLNLFGPTITLAGNLELNQLVLENYKHFYQQHIDQLLGTMDLTSKFDIAITPSAEQAQISINTDNQVTLNNIALDYQHMHQQAEMIQWQGNVDVSTDNRLQHTGTLKILASSTRDNTQQMDISVAELNLDSELTLNLPEFSDQATSAGLSGSIKNTLAIDGIDANYRHIKHKTGVMEWTGEIALASASDISINGNLKLSDIETIDVTEKYQIANIAQLEISDITQQADSLTIENIAIDSIQLVKQSDQQFLNLAAFSLAQLDFKLDSTALTIDRIAINQPDINVTLSENQTVQQLEPVLKTLAQLQTPTGTENNDGMDEKDVPAPESKPVDINIRQVTLLHPGTINFTDTGVSPHFQSPFKIDRLEIENIATTSPGQFDISINQGDYTHFAINGEGNLIDPRENLQLKAKITHLDLPPITSYTSKAMGYGMKSGAVDSDIELTLKQHVIDSHIKLKIDSIEVVETNSDTAEQISSASGMSIDLALSTLKDSDDVIELDLPIKGNIDEPDFDLSLIINKAMGQAMQSASLTYLKHSLQPFGALLTLYDLTKAAANYISLAPVTFEPNSLDFQDQQQELLSKVTQLLKDRPGIKIKTCAISNQDDQMAIKKLLIEQETNRLKQQFSQKTSKEVQQELDKAIEAIDIADNTIKQKMSELANQRSARVKAYFLEQSGVEAKRILNCLSRIETEGEFKPSVELQI